MSTETTEFARALDDLASTMAHNPDRLRQIRSRVERRRRRRVATGAAVSAGAVAATLGLAAIPRAPRSSVQSSVAAPGLPDCAAVPVPVPHVPTTLAGDKPATVRPATPEAVAQYKGYAVVRSVEGASITLGQLTGPGVLPLGDVVTALVDSTTTFENRGAPATLADVAIGLRVLFSTTLSDSGPHHLDYLDLGGGDAPAAATPEAVEAKKAAAEAATTKPDGAANEDPSSDGRIEGKGVVESATADELTVTGAVGQGDKAVLRLRVGTATQFFRYETACANDAQFVGAALMFGAVDNGDGTYTATDVHLFD